MIIVGKKCPSFEASAVVDGITIKTMTQEDLKGHYSLLFFYAVDFSAVCPTEINFLQDYIEEFKKRNVEIIAISIDSIYTHLAWLRTPRDKHGVAGATFAFLSDTPQRLSKEFGVFDEEQGVAYRGTFLIDEKLTIQYGAVSNRAFGRDIFEILRVIDAVQYATTHGVSCQANWKVGEEGVKNVIAGQ